MAKIDDFNASIPEHSPERRYVHHNQSACKYIITIKSEHRAPGKGGKKYCLKCKELN